MNTDDQNIVGAENDICVHPRSSAVPVPRVAIATRVATMDDLPFLDGLQKQHSKQLGFFPRAQMEGYVTNQWVLIAEDAATRQPLGYCASRDRYLKRDELGVIYQLCVVPGFQRGLIGANLIKAVFERSAYGCRLYCCWCAQDLAANSFWESLGFVPLAYRAGGRGSGVGRKNPSRPTTHDLRPTGPRVHIFWQRRIVDGDATPWWYPSQTNAGAIRADRLVFPIPPGTNWRDVRPPDIRPVDVKALALDEPTTVRERRARKPVAPIVALKEIAAGGLRFVAPQQQSVKEKPRRERVAKPVKACPERSRRIDPKLIAAARELRDRYLERVNAEPGALSGCGKYAVSRALPAPRADEPAPRALLEAA